MNQSIVINMLWWCLNNTVWKNLKKKYPNRDIYESTFRKNIDENYEYLYSGYSQTKQ